MRPLREAKGLSQGALAADAGIYQELIRRIESGAANPELDKLGKIAAAWACIRASCWRNDEEARMALPDRCLVAAASAHPRHDAGWPALGGLLRLAFRLACPTSTPMR